MYHVLLVSNCYKSKYMYYSYGIKIYNYDCYIFIH